MQLFLDSSDPKEIAEAREWGVIDGVTTNPSLISKAGLDKETAIRSVLEASPGPVFCQVIGWEEVLVLPVMDGMLGHHHMDSQEGQMEDHDQMEDEG